MRRVPWRGAGCGFAGRRALQYPETALRSGRRYQTTWPSLTGGPSLAGPFTIGCVLELVSSMSRKMAWSWSRKRSRRSSARRPGAQGGDSLWPGVPCAQRLPRFCDATLWKYGVQYVSHMPTNRVVSVRVVAGSVVMVRPGFPASERIGCASAVARGLRQGSGGNGRARNAGRATRAQAAQAPRRRHSWWKGLVGG